MNKEVIYLEPEDDITDILTKLQRAEQKLVALVPPKKATMLRSAVNMKLVARAAKECDKVAVIVTADPAIVKLAMTAQIPVAKTLQSRPVVPTKESLEASEAEEQVIDEDLAEKEPSSAKNASNGAKTAAEAANSASEKTSAKGGETLDLTDEGLENGSKGPKKANAKEKDGKKVPSLDKYRKWIIAGVGVAILLIVFGVWALVFAPAVKITVIMNTSATNFSEDITFTTEKAAENISEGKLYAEKITDERKFETEFTATGQEDRGEKAKGSLKLSYVINAATIKEALGEGISIAVAKGTEFTASNGLNYRATEAATLAWDGTIGSGSQCTSSSSCTLTATIPIEAANSGATYDVGTSATWKSNLTGITATSATAISGGTSKMVTVVTQADVNKAAEARNDNSESDGKTVLMSRLSDDMVAIESSYNVEVGELKSTPAVGEEAEGKVSLSATTVYSIYAVNKTALEDFIKAKTQVASDQRIYSIGEPYVEKFTNVDEPARLKTVVKTGPTVTEEDIFNKCQGKKIGEVQGILRPIDGVSSVSVEPSYFWVRTVPKDSAKVKIELTVEDN